MCSTALGTVWGPALSDPDHRHDNLFLSVRDRITAVCDYCAGIFDVREEVADLEMPLAAEFDDHPSLPSNLADGCELVTF